MEKEHNEKPKNHCRHKCAQILKQNLFLLFLLAGIVAGVVIGILIKVYDPDFHEDERAVMYLGFAGDMLLSMLKCMIIPLIVTSLMSGMAAIPGAASGRLGGLAVLYYMVTTIMAVLLGILLVTTIKPGDKVDHDQEGDEDGLVEPVDALLDLLRLGLMRTYFVVFLGVRKSTITERTEETKEHKMKDTFHTLYRIRILGMFFSDISLKITINIKTLGITWIILYWVLSN